MPDICQIKEKKFLEIALNLQFPYLRNYAYSICHMDNEAIPKFLSTDGGSSYAFNYGQELYLTIKHDDEPFTLYIPLYALKTKNPGVIAQRRYGYFTEYFRNKKVPFNFRKAMAILDYDMAKAFFEHVRQGK